VLVEEVCHDGKYGMCPYKGYLTGFSSGHVVVMFTGRGGGQIHVNAGDRALCS